MVKMLCVILVALGVAAPCVAQRRGVRDTQDNVRLIRNKPTIYIEFVKAGVYQQRRRTFARSWGPPPSRPDEETVDSYEAVWLRVRNNSRWAINFDALDVHPADHVDAYRLTGGGLVSGVRNGVEIRARYRVDAEIVWEWIETPAGREYKLVDIKAPIFNRVPQGLTSRVWLPPGRAAVFVVQREHLAKYLMVYLPYKHEWEASQNDMVSSEPQHRVYFDWYSLQKALGSARGRASPRHAPDRASATKRQPEVYGVIHSSPNKIVQYQ